MTSSGGLFDILALFAQADEQNVVSLMSNYDTSWQRTESRPLFDDMNAACLLHGWSREAYLRLYSKRFGVNVRIYLIEDETVRCVDAHNAHNDFVTFEIVYSEGTFQPKPRLASYRVSRPKPHIRIRAVHMTPAEAETVSSQRVINHWTQKPLSATSFLGQLAANNEWVTVQHATGAGEMELSFKHPNIVSFVARDGDTLATELCVGCVSAFLEGDTITVVEPLLNSNALPQLPVTMKQRALWCKQLLQTLVYLHVDREVVHRDLRPRNMLISYPTAQNGGEFVLKLANFGQARAVQYEPLPGKMGPVGWRAPEGTGTMAADMFSCGLAMYYILSGGRHAFQDCFDQEKHVERQQQRIDNGLAPLLLPLVFPDSIRSPQLSEGMLNIIRRLLSPEPLFRPSAAEVLQFELFNKETGIPLAKTPLAPQVEVVAPVTLKPYQLKPLVPEGQTEDQPLFSAVPPVSDRRFLNRSRDIAQIGNALTQSSVVGVVGDSGVGKTVLCAQLACHDSAATLYIDGIHWLSLGVEGSTIIELQQELIWMLTGEAPVIRHAQQGTDALAEALQRQRVLVVLDDARDEEIVCTLASAFPQNPLVGTHLIFSTRDLRICKAAKAEVVHLKPLDSVASLQMLCSYAKYDLTDEHQSVRELLMLCQGIPAALAWTGAPLANVPLNQLAGAVTATVDYVAAIAIERAAATAGRHEGPLFAVVPACIEGMRDTVAEEVLIKEHFAQLAAFEGVPVIPRPALRVALVASGVDVDFVPNVLKKLVERALLVSDENLTMFTMHSGIREYLAAESKRRGDEAALHSAIVDVYKQLCGGDWAKLPLEANGVAFNMLARHMHLAKRMDEFRTECLQNASYLLAKLSAMRVGGAGVTSLLKDFRLATGDKKIEVLRYAIVLSQAALRHMPEQLGAQLIARTLAATRFAGDDRYPAALGCGLALAKGTWLCAQTPLPVHMIRPVDPQIQLHLPRFVLLAVSPDDKRAYVHGDDRRLHVISLRDGTRIDRSPVAGSDIAVCASGQLAAIVEHGTPGLQLFDMHFVPMRPLGQRLQLRVDQRVASFGVSDFQVFAVLQPRKHVEADKWQLWVAGVATDDVVVASVPPLSAILQCHENRAVFAASGTAIIAWMEEGSLLTQFISTAACASCNNTCSRLVTSGPDVYILWDIVDHPARVVACLQLPTGVWPRADFSQTARGEELVIAPHHSNEVVLVNADDGVIFQKCTRDVRLNTVAMSGYLLTPDSNLLAVDNLIYDLRTGGALQLPSPVVHFSRDGKTAIMAAPGQGVSVLLTDGLDQSLTVSQLTQQDPTHYQMQCVWMLGSRVAVTTPTSLQVLEVSDMAFVGEYVPRVTLSVDGTLWHANGEHVACVEEHLLQVWNLVSGTEVLATNAPAQVMHLAVSSNGEWLSVLHAVSSSSGKVTVYKVKTNEVLLTDVTPTAFLRRSKLRTFVTDAGCPIVGVLSNDAEPDAPFAELHFRSPQLQWYAIHRSRLAVIGEQVLVDSNFNCFLFDVATAAVLLRFSCSVPPRVIYGNGSLLLSERVYDLEMLRMEQQPDILLTKPAMNALVVLEKTRAPRVGYAADRGTLPGRLLAHELRTNGEIRVVTETSEANTSSINVYDISKRSIPTLTAQLLTDAPTQSTGWAVHGDVIRFSHSGWLHTARVCTADGAAPKLSPYACSLPIAEVIFRVLPTETAGTANSISSARSTADSSAMLTQSSGTPSSAYDLSQMPSIPQTAVEEEPVVAAPARLSAHAPHSAMAAVIEVLQQFARNATPPHQPSVVQVEAGKCTFLKTHSSTASQPLFFCATCAATVPLHTICMSCAISCHAGHQIDFKQGVMGFCYCGAGKLTRCRSMHSDK